MVESETQVKAVIIDAAGVVDVDLAALAVIDEVVTEMGKQDVEVFIASASPRVANSLEAYDLLDVVGGLPLVTLDVRGVPVFRAYCTVHVSTPTDTNQPRTHAHESRRRTCFGR